MLREVVREALHQEHCTVAEALLAELRNPEFGIDVVVVEQVKK